VVHMRQDVSHQVNFAPLPCGTKEAFAHRFLNPQMSVRHHQPDLFETASF